MTMPDNHSQRSPLSDPLVKWFLGFFGAMFGFMLLPRALKAFFRRFLLGTFSEIVAIVVTGLLTEKAVDLIKKDEE